MSEEAPSSERVTLVKLAIQGVLATVVLVGMVWIILTPNASDAATKGALVIISSAAGFLFGKHSG
jgi:hypothetical protein